MAEPNNNTDPNNNQNQNQNGQQNQDPPAQQPAGIDYDKIQKMLDGTLSAKENKTLQSYFQQQGLTKEEAEQAIADFKQHKKDKEPDVEGMKTQLDGYKKAAMNAQIESKVYRMQSDLDIPAKTVPYLLKMMDKKGVVAEDGTIDEAKLKEACEKVLTDVPALKNQKKDPGNAGGFKVGGDGGSAPEDAKEAALRKAFGLK